ncbi:MAG: glycosyltransferase [Kiritimatiellae bacterium]|nr:glycosyltransferase [Kiritimatiellia bacterium]
MKSDLLKISSRDRGRASESVICSALSWSRLKNVKNALKAFRLFLNDHPEFAYHLMGPGLEHGGPAYEWARSKNLLDGVIFLGNLPQGECLRKIQDAKIYFHSSLEESFGMPVCEALLLNVPVVFTRQARGCAYCSNNGKYGIMANGHSPQSMAAALKEAYDNARDDNLLREGRKFALSLCDPGVVLSQYQGLYNKLAGCRALARHPAS